MEIKAKVVLAHKVFNKIRWFTHNYDKEIGAVGTGKIRESNGEKYFYIDKLFFPKQDVTASTVHFTTEMWGDIIRQTSMKDLGQICFYWHKHPGSASHSQTDEEDTFETFMSKEAKRKYFIFLQTAGESGETMDIEARIDIRTPIRATILNKDIKIARELTEDDKVLSNECKKIIKECVDYEKKEEETTITLYDNDEDGYYVYQNGYKVWKRYDSTYQKDIGWDGLYTDTEIDLELEDNDNVMEEKHFASIQMLNGGGHIQAGEMFKRYVNTALGKKGILEGVVRQQTQYDKDGVTTYYLQPKPKGFLALKDSIEKLYILFRGGLVKKWGFDKETKIKEDVKKMFDDEIYEIKDDEFAVQQFLDEIVSVLHLSWNEDGTFAIAKDFLSREVIGTITTDLRFNDITFRGAGLIGMIKDVKGFFPTTDEVKNELQGGKKKNGKRKKVRPIPAK